MLNIGYVIMGILQEMRKLLFVSLSLIFISCSSVRKTVDNDEHKTQTINVPIWIPNSGIMIESKIYYIKNKKTKKT